MAPKDVANRHCIVVSFDSPNHGSRRVNAEANGGWQERQTSDMWSRLYSTARTVSELMDVIEHDLFGPAGPGRGQ
ncbi:hypothetical protein G6F46_011686 [Rhizopus delemar]|uniref:Uncharacterized protein n=2 Tax=Rhizopus TaxID=4842 RepID=A0A9P6YRN9_9FUNG|nr:hypothetical protein G6F55_011867 [Rhizopus delemar]KAG1534501.1 hypothetical protein G6F51_012062 [Rhizopus arrhizus]KAG1491185.1 hypothetical protein G6F54_010198 [Rhizopus delemar]KAG1498577.1 hypothetical protein G6F53_011712 [Rhizopus delemar]KAG1511654.1 hypothetical protein G6F52_010598 [Rhizopus delemar]